MVATPASLAISSARSAASIGCSSWVTKTPAERISAALASMSSAEMKVAAPGQTMIALLPVVSSTKM
jgi:hypothetical protein